MSQLTLNTVGTLIKKEDLQSVKNETYSNYMVLESSLPFPGYHGTTIPDHLEPALMFALTEVNYNDERVIRAIRTVKSQINITFDATPGTLKYQNKDYTFIRFKKLPYSNVGAVLDAFVNIGIQFKKKKNVSSYTTLIKVRKFFSLKEISEGIFEDMMEPENNYLLLPTGLTWNQFEKTTMQIKYNLEDKNFDAAQASLYGKDGMLDFVRIYDRDVTQSKLKYIRNKYLDTIRRL